VPFNPGSSSTGTEAHVKRKRNRLNLVLSALQLAMRALAPRFPAIECHYLQGGFL
jgi:hypothetical protein